MSSQDSMSVTSVQLRLAMQAARAGGVVIKAGYGKLWKISEKGVGDLVSEVDTEAERTIVAVIRSKDESSNIISEESEYEQDTKCPSQWIIDPLDGTAAFLLKAGADKPSVLIAHQQDGVTDVAVVYFPLTDECFYAVKGEGAYVRKRERLESRGVIRLRKAWVEMNQYGDSSLETHVFATLRTRLRSSEGARLVTSGVPHSGVAMRMFDGTSDLSAVIHDNNPRKVKQAVWDVVAVRLIVEEAGGVVVNMQGEPYDIRKPEPFIMATSRELAVEIINLAYR